MHTLHTSEAFVLQKFPHGESNYTYKLLTKKLGLLYAHGQATRELKSRNRYALQVGQVNEVTLVKGREVWRVTGAKMLSSETEVFEQEAFRRKILMVIGTLLPVEETVEGLFDVLKIGLTYPHQNKKERQAIEAITLLRAMDKLGFVARPVKEARLERYLSDTDMSPELVEEAKQDLSMLVGRVNSALQEAK